MDMNAITSFIGQFGFPILACGVMAWYVKYITDKNSKEVNELHTKYDESLKEMNDSHSQSMEEIKEAINNNTLALQHLCDIIKIKGEE